MKVFISWSGERSRQVGELLDEWLQCVLQALYPWMSSKDIDRGTLWFNEINNQLKDTGLGIICLTAENLNKPWILFEAGALSKGLSSNKVFTFLIDIESQHVGDPLGQFNHTFPEKGSLRQLVNTLNSLFAENALKESVLDKVFETYWPQFEERFSLIIKSTKDADVEIERTENDILLDILSSTRNLDRRIRNIESERYKRNIISINNGELNNRKKNEMYTYNEIVDVVKSLANENYEKKYILERLNSEYGISGRDSIELVNRLFSNKANKSEGIG